MQYRGHYITKNIIKNINITGSTGITFPDHDNLTGEECYELVKIYRDTSIPEYKRILARNLVIDRHHKFIIRIVKTYWNCHKDKNFDDLWQIANEGFIAAFDKVDVEKLKDIKFFSYAVYWIKAYLTDDAKNAGNIRYSASYHRNMKSDHTKATKKCKCLSTIQRQHNWNEFMHKWGYMQSNMDNNMLSLDQKIDPNSNNTISDTISTNESDGTVNVTCKNILMKSLHKTINHVLSSVEKRAVSSMYGIESQENTLTELSTELNISKVRTKKIINTALKKIRKDKGFKKVISTLNIMTSITKGTDVFSLFNQQQ